MIEDIWSALLLILHFVGMIALGYCLTLRLLRLRPQETCWIILPLRSGTGAQDRIYTRYLRLRLLGESAQCAVVALDLGLNEREKRDCMQFCRSVPHVYFCAPQELASVLETIQKDF